MKRMLLSFAIVSLLVSSGWTQEQKRIGLEDMFLFKNISQTQFSPDGQRIAFVVSENDFLENRIDTDIWLAYADGRPAVKLVASLKSDTQPRWSPDGKKLAFLSSRDGRMQIYLMDMEKGGEAWKLSDHKTGIQTFKWAPDGKTIYFLAKAPRPNKKKSEPDVKVIDESFDYTQLWAITLKGKSIKQLTHGKINIDNFDISPDGKAIAFGARPTPKVPDFFNSDLYILELDTKKPQPKKLVEQPGIDTDPHFSPDGQTVVFSSTDGVKEWIRNRNLYRIPVSGGRPKNITKNFDEHASFVAWSSDGNYVYFYATEGVARHLYRVPARGGKVKKITGGHSVHGAFDVSPDGRTIVFMRENAEHPDELFVSRVSRYEPKQVSAVNAIADEYRIADSEIISWKGADGWTIEGILTKPVDYQPGQRYPLILLIHGGPAGVFVNSFTASPGRPVQWLAAKGYAVLMPNPRGSGGYGEKFRKANLRDWGGKDYRDIMAGVDFVIQRGIADPDRMGVMGWSYGGFMTSWIITQTERFKAARVGAGVTNLYSFYGQTDIPDFMEFYFASLPWTDAAVFKKHSALYFIDRVKTPTLILHGENDLRVPLAQGRELYTALKEMGVPVEFVVYPRQGHGVREPRLMRDVALRTVAWFDRWIFERREAGLE
ncbi:MAG: S9 family peptidase [candidate division KSB1 bacterium]|nr:S9 family peptidase [candidate division KSB1 bacterium]